MKFNTLAEAEKYKKKLKRRGYSHPVIITHTSFFEVIIPAYGSIDIRKESDKSEPSA